MRRARQVAGKDLRVLWASPVPYVVAAAFHVSLGLLYVAQLEERRQALLQPMFPIAGFLLLLTVPIITMRSFAEEARAGTLDLLVAAGVPDLAMVAGKWLASWITSLAVLAPSTAFVFLLHLYGRPDPGPMEAGYLGLVLLAAVLCGLGVLSSAASASQPVAAMVAVFVALVLWFVRVGSASVAADAWVARVSLSERLRTFAGGAIDTGDLGFFVVGTAATLVVAIAVLRSRRLR